MSIFNNKIRLPLLMFLLGTVVGALTGEFVWALLAGPGVWAIVVIAQNLSAFVRRTNSRGPVPVSDVGEDEFMSPQDDPDWLQKWMKDMNYCPTYKGTPGNIWNGPKWASRH